MSREKNLAIIIAAAESGDRTARKFCQEHKIAYSKALQSTSRSRITGTQVDIWDLSTREGIKATDLLDEYLNGDRWGLICVEHGGIVAVRSLAQAKQEAADPRGWCPHCQE